jgi:hypothetical protein
MWGRGPVGGDRTKRCVSRKAVRTLDVFALFLEIMQLLVEETTHYHQYLYMLDEGHAPLPDVTMQEMYLFVSVTVQMVHNQSDQ